LVDTRAKLSGVYDATLYATEANKVPPETVPPLSVPPAHISSENDEEKESLRLPPYADRVLTPIPITSVDCWAIETAYV